MAEYGFNFDLELVNFVFVILDLECTAAGPAASIATKLPHLNNFIN